MPEMSCPQQLMGIALVELKDTDETIAQAGISTLGMLADTAQGEAALAALLPVLDWENWRSRMYLAYALKSFKAQSAKDALIKLRQDKHHKVVAAALENLLSP